MKLCTVALLLAVAALAAPVEAVQPLAYHGKLLVGQ